MTTVSGLDSHIPEDGGPPFAILVPLNASAKAAFDRVFERDIQRNGANLSGRTMRVGPERTLDRSVMNYRLQELRNIDKEDHSESPTDLDTDTEAQFEFLGLIWNG